MELKKSSKKLITLLTDFGSLDSYVGIMKGVIYSINPDATIVDLTHEIPPQDLHSGLFNLLRSVPFFPPETIHVAIVDPGVGTKRRGIAVKFKQGYLIGPDNGLMSGVFDIYPPESAVELTNTKYWRDENPSSTFHGRDIFSPVAAHLSKGVPFLDLGKEIGVDTLTKLELPKVVATEKGALGVIQYIDVYGNIISNIPNEHVNNKSFTADIASKSIKSVLAYGDADSGELLTLEGSHGFIEIAVNKGNAAKLLNCSVGEPITVKII